MEGLRAEWGADASGVHKGSGRPLRWRRLPRWESGTGYRAQQNVCGTARADIRVSFRGGGAIFVSYYDFYQPEEAFPRERYLHRERRGDQRGDRAFAACPRRRPLTRRDTIIVASVSCIYGLGSPEEYERENLRSSEG